MKIATQAFHVVDSDDFGDAVSEFFGVDDYNFAANEEVSDGNSRTYTVKEDYILDKYWEDQFFGWKNGSQYYAPGPVILLGLMCAEGAIPAGEYLIKVSW